jgi:hypothetical protein
MLNARSISMVVGFFYDLVLCVYKVVVMPPRFLAMGINITPSVPVLRA